MTKLQISRLHLGTDHIESTHVLLRECMLRLLPSNGYCLQNHRLATCLYATILTFNLITVNKKKLILIK
jgi:hypothetical protein